MPALSPRTPATTATRPVPPMIGADASRPPDARELASIGVAALAGVLAWSLSLGTQALGPWLPATLADATPAGALLAVAARFFPWLLTLALISVAFSIRWLPRAHQRLLEPSLIAAWVAVLAGGGIAYGLGQSGLWPWVWASTAPDVTTVLTQFVVAEQFVALAAWLVAACLLVPLVLELVFRHALLEYLRARGLATWVAVTASSVAFGATSLGGFASAPNAALRHAVLASALGALLALLVLRGRRGRGLGLAILAHAAFAAVQLGVLIRAIVPS